MDEKKFSSVATAEKSPNWEKLTSRQYDMYQRTGDVRDPFVRDYTRVLHSMAYRRLKHKTQVFFNIDNDHICTRMEHVSHVESVSFTIARALGLNTELTKAISIGHDLGHAPFGHQGERVLAEISKKHLKTDFWHEKNGLRFVDKIELLEDPQNKRKNLPNLCSTRWYSVSLRRGRSKRNYSARYFLADRTCRERWQSSACNMGRVRCKGRR